MKQFLSIYDKELLGLAISDRVIFLMAALSNTPKEDAEFCNRLLCELACYYDLANTLEIKLFAE